MYVFRDLGKVTEIIDVDMREVGGRLKVDTKAILINVNYLSIHMI